MRKQTTREAFRELQDALIELGQVIVTAWRRSFPHKHQRVLFLIPVFAWVALLALALWRLH